MALIAWVTAGLIAMLGAAAYAELGTAIPESGGEYQVMQKSRRGEGGGACIMLPCSWVVCWSSCMLTGADCCVSLPLLWRVLFANALLFC